MNAAFWVVFPGRLSAVPQLWAGLAQRLEPYSVRALILLAFAAGLQRRTWVLLAPLALPALRVSKMERPRWRLSRPLRQVPLRALGVALV